jgi:alpha-tubulin suppressor-like RCC1 family protein
VPVAGGLTFTAVTAGEFETCGLTASGAAYCWGAGGIGNPIGNSPTPVSVAGGLTFATVSTGYGHACGVTTAGVAYCWGNGYDGELGNGTTNASATPTPVAGGLIFAAVSAGRNHSCGVTTSGVAYCWGANWMGQLGVGTSTGPEQCPNNSGACSTVPVAVAGGLTFQTVIAASGHTCGVTTSAASYCWGDNVAGVLGNGTNTGPEQCNEPAPDPWDGPSAFPCSSVPVAVAGGLNLASLTSGGSAYACGLTAAGATYCWGTSPNGDLTPAPVAVASGFTFATLSTGETSTCGVTTAGVAYCWGSNDHGQLGDGSRTSSSVPVKVYGQP